jgi:thiamine-phosphate pyrophosphorylase
LSVAGDWRLAARIGAGLHLREGRWPGAAPRWLPVLTASAHGIAGLRRARRAGAGVAFLSPVFATSSHPGAPALGPLRWELAARRGGGGMSVGALGGVTGHGIRRISRNACRAVGAIAALIVKT